MKLSTLKKLQSNIMEIKLNLKLGTENDTIQNQNKEILLGESKNL